MHAVTPCTRAVCLFTAVLVLAPCLHAQPDTPASKSESASIQLYTLKFDGRDVDSLEQQLKAAFPSDNVVIAPSAKYVPLDAFEVRDVRLQELGKTIEFLGEGRLTVEVIEKEEGTTGNIWRIAAKRTPGTGETANLKMRSVAAPNLFANQESLDRLIADANQLEGTRLRYALESASVRGGDLSGVAKTEIRPLPQQKLFAIVGNEEGIAGIESFIKAAEQLAVEEAAEKRALTASLAPKMRAVVAPHLFANAERLDEITEEFNTVQGAWDEVHLQLMKTLGIDGPRGEVCVEPHPKQKLFVLYGSEEGIAGMESLIQAAEKNAAEEDARVMAIIMAERAEEKAIEERKAADAAKAAEKAKQGE